MITVRSRAKRPRRTSPVTVLHMASLGVFAVSGGMVVAGAVAVIVGDGAHWALAGPGLVGLVVAGAIWRSTAISSEVTTTTALAAVAWTWLAAAGWGAAPFLLQGTFAHPADALFESVSGFTGTGSTVLAPIEGNDRGILFWRSMTQWFGGMGMVVLAVAVLPFLGVGGLELIRSEAPGPDADRLAPRVSETAKRLWAVYLGFTAISVLALLLVGLDLYDSVVHAFTTVSTGGFSPYDASIGHYSSVGVEVVLIVLMLAGATSFTLHWRAVTRGEVRGYLTAGEFRFYLVLFMSAAAAVTVVNAVDGGMGMTEAGRKGIFTVASLISSTGFGVDDFTTWAPAAQIVLLFLLMTGGMAGSTAGGMKTLRVHAMVAQAFRESRRARHPRGVLPLRLAARAVPDRIVRRIAGFVLLYVVVGVVSVLVIAAGGADLETAVGAVATAMGNGGPGLGDAGTDFLIFTRPERVYLALLMLVGRLEIFAILIGLGLLFERPWKSLMRGRRAILRPGVIGN